MATDLHGRDATGLEVVRGLLRGASVDDLAWATGRDPDEVLRMAREAVSPPDEPEPREVAQSDRRRILDYLLLRQSPGQAAGTWELLEGSPAASAWALAARERLTELYPAEPPALPDAEGAPSVAERTRGARGPERRGRVGRRRAERRRMRRRVELQSAIAVELSPFREEAVHRHAGREDEIRLPHYASRPVRLALYGLLAVLGAVLAMSVLVSVPVYTTAKVLVVDLPEGVPSGEFGLSMLALFPEDTLESVEEGRSLRVQLPDTEERVSSEMTYVEDEILGPQEIADRYDLPALQAKRVRSPHAVAVAELRTPDGAPPRDSFEGVVTEEAEAYTGSKRIIELLF